MKTGAGTSLSRHLYGKRVQFSESSVMYMYLEDSTCPKRNLSLNAYDQESAAKMAITDAVRIDAELRSRPRKPNESFEEHLARCGIPKEEVLGIEHLIGEDRMRIFKRRQRHLQLILTEQGKSARGCNSGERLARLSAVLTKRPASQAKQRAAMAA